MGIDRMMLDGRDMRGHIKAVAGSVNALVRRPGLWRASIQRKTAQYPETNEADGQHAKGWNDHPSGSTYLHS